MAQFVSEKGCVCPFVLAKQDASSAQPRPIKTKSSARLLVHHSTPATGLAFAIGAEFVWLAGLNFDRLPGNWMGKTKKNGAQEQTGSTQQGLGWTMSGVTEDWVTDRGKVSP